MYHKLQGSYWTVVEATTSYRAALCWDLHSHRPCPPQKAAWLVPALCHPKWPKNMLTMKTFFFPDSCVEDSSGEINRGWRLSTLLLPHPLHIPPRPGQAKMCPLQKLSLIFWMLIFARTELPLANSFNHKHIVLEMDNLLRNLLWGHTLKIYPWLFGCWASRLLEPVLPAAVCWLLPRLAGLSHPSYVNYRGLLTELLYSALHIIPVLCYFTSCLLGICLIF